MPPDPLDVCTFNAHHIYQRKNRLHACGRYLRFSTRKENQKDYSPNERRSVQNGKYNDEQTVQTVQTVKTVKCNHYRLQ